MYELLQALLPGAWGRGLGPPASGKRTGHSGPLRGWQAEAVRHVPFYDSLAQEQQHMARRCGRCSLATRRQVPPAQADEPSNKPTYPPAQVAESMEPHTYAKHEMIVRQGDEAAALFVIAAGEARRPVRTMSAPGLRNEAPGLPSYPLSRCPRVIACRGGAPLCLP